LPFGYFRQHFLSPKSNLFKLAHLGYEFGFIKIWNYFIEKDAFTQMTLPALKGRASLLDRKLSILRGFIPRQLRDSKKFALKLPREPVSWLLGITPARSNRRLLHNPGMPLVHNLLTLGRVSAFFRTALSQCLVYERGKFLLFVESSGLPYVAAQDWVRGAK
jgi:hypothetical protein